MTYVEAVRFLKEQDRSIRKVNNTRFVEGGYEYRVTYEGGLASFVAIDRRKIGKRKFEYFSGVSAVHCRTAEDVMKLVYDEVKGVAK